MSDGLTIAFDERSQEILRFMPYLPEMMLKAIARGMDRGLALAVGQITRERFTGQGPFPVGERRLGVRSNRLRSSLRWNINGSPSKIEGQSVTGSVGSNVEYAGVHEYGSTKEVTVRGFLRKRFTVQQFLAKEKKPDKVKLPKRTKGMTAEEHFDAVQDALRIAHVNALHHTPERELVEKRVRGRDITVNSHRRKMNVPERAPLRTGLADHSGTITAQISAALHAAWQERWAQ